MTASTYVPAVARPLVAIYRRASTPTIRLGHMLVFFVRALVAVPASLRQYRKEFLRLLSDIAWGNGSIVVGGALPGWRWCSGSPRAPWSPSRATTF